jgi:hypothetical protein
VLKTVFKHGRLYMNLTGHTLNMVWNFEKLAYIIVSSASESLLVMCLRDNHNNSVHGTRDKESLYQREIAWRESKGGAQRMKRMHNREGGGVHFSYSLSSNPFCISYISV